MTEDTDHNIDRLREYIETEIESHYEECDNGDIIVKTNQLSRQDIAVIAACGYGVADDEFFGSLRLVKDTNDDQLSDVGHDIFQMLTESLTSREANKSIVYETLQEMEPVDQQVFVESVVENTTIQEEEEVHLILQDLLRNDVISYNLDWNLQTESTR